MAAKKMHRNKSMQSKNTTDDPTAIVGIGASAGGLEAFSRLLNSLPVDTGMSFIFIQHLEPTHESKLSEIFSKYTKMPVQQISDNVKVKKDQVYIIPPGKYISIQEDELVLSEREKTDGLYLPINYFFKSLAKEVKERAIGIILSGTASDGTEGLKSIKSEGGLTFAQDQTTAKYPGMPTSAIDSGNVDFILPPEKIASELVRIGLHPYIAFPVMKEQEIAEKENGDAFSLIFNKLRLSTGVDFSDYKLNTVRRRVSRRMVLNKIISVDDYANLIKESNYEVQELYRDLLINVTNFYRDREVFDILKTKVFPEISNDMRKDNPIRIWIPGCSTGEEVYSIVISLFEYLESTRKTVHAQVFATDISDSAIIKARNGIYPEADLKDLPDEILRKYFSKTNGVYQINKMIRDSCIFARQDITKDAPFSRIDLISCRNLLIYFSPDLQKKIIPILHYSLKPGGFLLLGTSESIGVFGDHFNLIDKKYKLYTKKNNSSRMDFKFSHNEPSEKVPLNNLSEHFSSKINIQKEADKTILNNYTPPGILINSEMEIIQFRGQVSKYLDPSAGDASLNIFKMLKETFNLDLHTAIRNVKQTNAPVIIDSLDFDSAGSSKLLDLEVIPIKTGNDLSYLILFRERNTEAAKKKEQKSTSQTMSEIEKLRKELIITKENLHSIIEEREATNEDLRSALEELQSGNEELQSTNEEMETAREELQSTNEELITVNDELESRNDQLNELNNDLNNLLASVNIPIIMLGRDLKIRRYTPQAEKIWNLITGDIGRPIENIKPNIEISNFKEHIFKVLDNFNSNEIQVKDNEGNRYSLKIRPYSTTDNKIVGVIISLYKNEALGKGELSQNFINDISGSSQEASLILDDKFRIIEANNLFFEMFSIKPEDSIGKLISQIGFDDTNNAKYKELFGEIIYGKKEFKNLLYVLRYNDKEAKKLLLNAEMFRVPIEDKEYLLLKIKEIE